MRSFSALYDQIVANEHWFELQIVFQNGTVVEDDIVSIDPSAAALPKQRPSIGGAVAAMIRLTIIKPSFTIPRRGSFVLQFRASNMSQASEWIDIGTFFVDTRKDVAYGSNTTTVIQGYDALIKSERPYPNTSHAWPYRDTLVVAEIASAIGVDVDPRTYSFLTAARPVDLPYEKTMREVIESVAAANAGNFVITADNKLLFVPLYGLDPDITGRYLADGNGNAIVLGNEGWCILV